jgi:hypothetical protein
VEEVKANLDVGYTNAQERAQVYNKEMEATHREARVLYSLWQKRRDYSYQVLTKVAAKGRKVSCTSLQPLRFRKNENGCLELLCRIYGYSSWKIETYQ